MICSDCPHCCNITENYHGICKTHRLVNGRVACGNYGEVTALALDPIEKKPLKHFMPGSRILSVGFWGCNMKCPWCQNDTISRDFCESIYMSPEELVGKALSTPRNIGIAYTYNEPLISIDFIEETAKLASEKGLKNVLVTNGMVNARAFYRLLPYINALNVDLKTIDPDKYKAIGGNLDAILGTIKRANKSAHVELTTLIVPGFNDIEADMEKLAQTVAAIDNEMVLHVTRFFPAGNMKNAEPTPVETVYKMADIARKHLKHVYEGNI